MHGLEQFIREKTYLVSVSPRTVEWYRQSFKWLGEESPNQTQLKDFVIRMRQAGLKPSAVNNRIRAVNSYLKWCQTGQHIPKLKEEQRLLPTFTLQQVQRLTHYKPHGFYQRRLHLVVLVLLDCGLRISECLNLKMEDLDFDNLLMRINGKGKKQRRIPFSMELRRMLYKYTTEFCQPHQLVFGTKDGRELGRRVILRDVKLLCQRLGFVAAERSLHAMRHTMAVNYLRRGGSVFHLQRVLGHSSLDMTRRYCNLNAEDLQAVHQKYRCSGVEQRSLLSAA